MSYQNKNASQPGSHHDTSKSEATDNKDASKGSAITKASSAELVFSGVNGTSNLRYAKHQNAFFLTDAPRTDGTEGAAIKPDHDVSLAELAKLLGFDLSPKAKTEAEKIVATHNDWLTTLRCTDDEIPSDISEHKPVRCVGNFRSLTLAIQDLEVTANPVDTKTSKSAKVFNFLKENRQKAQEARELQPRFC